MTADAIGAVDPRWQVVTAGDVCYERDMAHHIIPWLRALAGGGCLVLLADPGRAYLPTEGLLRVASHTVPTSRELEDSAARDGVVWRVLPP
jgi:predicted nicotinamide N-methyase